MDSRRASILLFVEVSEQVPASERRLFQTLKDILCDSVLNSDFGTGKNGSASLKEWFHILVGTNFPSGFSERKNVLVFQPLCLKEG